MATLEQRIRALEARVSTTSRAVGYVLTDDELAGVIQLLEERGDWDEDAYNPMASEMTDVELSAILMPLVAEWRAQHGNA